jgi:hypothetical protein
VSKDENIASSIAFWSDVINDISSDILDEFGHPFVMREQKVLKTFVDVVARKLLLNLQTLLSVRVVLAAQIFINIVVFVRLRTHPESVLLWKDVPVGLDDALDCFCSRLVSNYIRHRLLNLSSLYRFLISW